jgi:hypothetical protein
MIEITRRQARPPGQPIIISPILVPLIQSPPPPIPARRRCQDSISPSEVMSASPCLASQPASPCPLRSIDLSAGFFTLLMSFSASRRIQPSGALQLQRLPFQKRHHHTTMKLYGYPLSPSRHQTRGRSSYSFASDSARWLTKGLSSPPNQTKNGPHISTSDHGYHDAPIPRIANHPAS